MTVGNASAILPSLLVLFALTAFPGESGADLYEYKDGNGTVCITDKLQSVPAKYRNGMQVIKDDSHAKPAPSGRMPQEAPRLAPPLAPEAPKAALGPKVEAGPKAEVAAPAAPAGRFGELALRYRWFKPLAIVGALVVGLLIIGQVARLLPSARLGRVIYFAFFAAIFAFAYKSYADQVVNNYLMVRESVLSVFKKTNQRELPPLEEKESETAGGTAGVR